MPRPWRRSDTDWQSGQRSGTRSLWPQWWHDTRPLERCSTSDTSQSGHCHTRPHSAQVRKFDQPRRLSSTIAFSPRLGHLGERVAGARVQRVGHAGHPDQLHRRQRLAVHTLGQLEPAVALEALGPRRRAARQQHAIGRAGAPLGHGAGVVARIAVLLVRPSCSSSTTISPTSVSGANTADRGPTQTVAAPERSRAHSS